MRIYGKALFGAIALWAMLGTQAAARSVSTAEMFDAAAEGQGGVAISAESCHQLELLQTAVWVTVRGRGWCLRYYAFGLGRENPIAAAWLHGDIVGSATGHGPADKHQHGLGVAAMIDQERRLAEHYRIPFVFLARPGAYGSAGDTRRIEHTGLEADLVAAELDALTVRYGVKAWVLGGHSGGGSLTAAMAARRSDIRCAVVSSGAPDYKAYLAAHHAEDQAPAASLDAVGEIGRQPTSPSLRVIVMGDPRDSNILWPLQQAYYAALTRHGVNATLAPLERGEPPEFHSLVSLAEAATGLCADGISSEDIVTRLEAMPSQTPRVSN
jgi:pimeloyl-ACP methyl ester carboxylesterase